MPSGYEEWGVSQEENWLQTGINTQQYFTPPGTTMFGRPMSPFPKGSVVIVLLPGSLATGPSAGPYLGRGSEVVVIEPAAAASGISTGGGSTTLYRGMTPDEEGNPMLGPSAKTLGARPNVDVFPDEEGVIQPGPYGMSVNESPTGAPAYRVPESFGGTAKNLSMYSIEDSDLPPGLTYTPDATLEGHGFITPTVAMPVEDYQTLLEGTQGLWIEVEP